MTNQHAADEASANDDTGGAMAHTRRRGRSAFTLIEVLLALTISGIIAAAATTAVIGMYRSLTAMEQQTQVDEDAKIIIDVLLTELVQAGGGAARPWVAVSNRCDVGDGLPACVGEQTRLHLLRVDDRASAGRIVAWDGSSASLDIDDTGECPIRPERGWPNTGKLVALLPNLPAGGGWVSRLCVPRIAPGCGCALTAVDDATDLLPAADITVEVSDWAGGQMLAAEPVSYYVDAARRLMVRRDVDNDLAIEDTVVAEDIYDFRVEFGVDHDPADGVLDVPWLSTVLTDQASSIRMARAGVIVGGPAPSRDQPSEASLFGGTPITTPRGVLLRSASGAVAMRNILVFF